MTRPHWHRNIDALLEAPAESLEVEIKNWLDLTSREDQANLAKAMIALANHGGGVVLMGFTEAPQGYVPSDQRPADLSNYSTDSINGVLRRFAEPPFHCDTYQATDPATGQHHPAILVPGGHDVPIRSKRAGPDGKGISQNTYYIRRPGPASEPPQSGQEWSQLLRRCIVNAKSELLDQFRLIITQGSAVPAQQDDRSTLDEWHETCIGRWRDITAELEEDVDARFPHGFYSVAYMFSGVHDSFQKSELQDALRRGRVSYTGAPPFAMWNYSDDQLYPYNDGIECWLGDKHSRGHPHYADYWRVSSGGMFFLMRGYQEDGQERIEPGTGFDLVLPTWKLGELLLHAASIAEQLGLAGEKLTFAIRWNGLSGRKLINIGAPNRILVGRYVCRQDNHSAVFETLTDGIRDTLPELVSEALTPLYELFAFFRLPPDLIVQELNHLRKGSY